MGYRKGPSTGWTSHELKRIFQELKKGNSKYQTDAMLCPNRNCRSGFVIDHTKKDPKPEECPDCGGWGIVRKN